MANPLSPLAPGASTQLLTTLPVAQLIAEWKDTFDIDIAGELAGTDVISLYRCDASQLDFFVPVTAAGSQRLYEGLQKYDWYYMPDKWEFSQAIGDLVGCTRILEVGCGAGLFVERLMQWMPASFVRGIETNEEAIQQALQKNLPVERTDLAGLRATGESFDAVCSFQVLEHLGHPREFLEDMVSVLKPGGKLIVSVPNKNSFLKLQYNLLDMPPHHMTRWSVETFRYLQQILPLKLICSRCEPLTKYHISGYIAAYGQHWRSRLSVVRPFLSESKLTKMAGIVERLGLNRLLRGQSLYVIYEKL